MEVLLVIGFIGVVVTFAILGAIAARKRREALAALAASLGLRFEPEKDRGIDERYGFLSRLNSGSNRYAANKLSGRHRDHDVQAFDYHYETHSTDSKGHRQTHHHHFSYFILRLPRRFPEVTITREGFLSKLAQAVGYDDIDFESAEFSRRFCVRSRDKKFAYDICHPRMMEYLLANDDLNVEIDQDCLAIVFSGHLAVPAIASNLERLVELRDRFPDYLWSQR